MQHHRTLQPVVFVYLLGQGNRHRAHLSRISVKSLPELTLNVPSLPQTVRTGDFDFTAPQPPRSPRDGSSQRLMQRHRQR
ncbi:hypothetical protein HOE425_340049 [Hoeflea sp. EC-HK425]|nr:hypothetical protein HOE425_340049 [Hoeflea sp. EC-HK425]